MGYFLGLSLSISGIGGLLAGLWSQSLKRVLLWALGFGLFEVFLKQLYDGGFAPIFLIIALFWGLLGWFTFGRRSARKLAAEKVNASE